MTSGIEKAAMLMLTLNNEVAAKVINLMEEDEIKAISHSMSRLGAVPSSVIEQIINEFQSSLDDNSSFIGNMQSTERFLRRILGKDKVDNIMEDIRGPAGRNIWDKLGNVGEDVLANYLKNEYPQTAALIITKLNPNQAAGVLGLLSQDFAFEIIKRMLMMESVKKEVLDKVEKTLRTEFIGGLSKSHKTDNNQRIAEIFNNLSREKEGSFMTMLEQHDQSSADRIKNLMFTFEDVKRISSVGMQVLMKNIDKSKLATALKGTNEEIRTLFLKSMSQRAANILSEDIANMGPVKLKEVEKAQFEIIASLKELITRGEIDISSSEEDMVY